MVIDKPLPLCSWHKFKVRLMATRTLINTMHGSVGRTDRAIALEGCESIARRVRFWPTRRRHLAVIKELLGVEMLIDLLKVWMHDVPVTLCAIRALCNIAVYSTIEVDYMLDLGGLMLAEECINTHGDDVDVQEAAKTMIKVLSQRSTSVAVRELRLCCACAVNNVDIQCAAELGRIMENDPQNRARITIDCVSRRRGTLDLSSVVGTVLNHMRAHMRSERVQDVGLDALTELSRRVACIENALLSLNAPEVVVDAMRKHPRCFQIQWKACLVINFMAKKQSLSSDLGKRGAVTVLKLAFNNFKGDREVQQQAIWAMEALANVQANIERFHHENIQACVVEVLRRDADPKIRIDSTLSLPINLRSVWTNQQLGVALSNANKGKKQTTSKADIDETRVTPSSTPKLSARRGKSRYNRISDEYTSGTSGLID